MRRYDKDVLNLKRKYEGLLNNLYNTDPVSIDAYIWYKRMHKVNLTEGRYREIVSEAKQYFGIDMTSTELDKFLNSKMLPVKDILQAFKTELVEFLVQNNIHLNHVTTYAPDKINRVILPQKAETIYHEEEGKFVYASLSDNSKYAYAGRAHNGGMINLGTNIVLYLTGDNFEISEKTLKTKRPVYCYSLSAKDFQPVVTIRKDKGVHLVFDDEWISTVPQQISYKQCEDLTDITPLLEHKQVLFFKGGNIHQNLSIVSRLQLMQKRSLNAKLQSLIKEGVLIHLNKELKNVHTI